LYQGLQISKIQSIIDILFVEECLANLLNETILKGKFGSKMLAKGILLL
jgi:hypothetical protein